MKQNIAKPTAQTFNQVRAGARQGGRVDGGQAGWGENGRGAGERGRVVLAVNRPLTMQSFSQPTRPTSISQDFWNTFKKVVGKICTTHPQDL